MKPTMKRIAVVLSCLLFTPFFALVEAQTATSASTNPPPDHLSASPDNMRVLRDLPYVSNGEPRQKLDLYLPNTPGPARPLVIFIHGGAWRAGSKENNPAKFLVPSGYVVASINYRFTQDAKFPAQIEDCKSAIRWLRAHAAEYGIDPRRIGVWGASAGGHLVALLGVTGQTKDFDQGENLDQSSAVQCVVDWYGPTDFLTHKQVIEPKYGNSSVEQLLGGSVKDHPDAARKASPFYHVTKAAAPFLIMHGEQDPLVEVQQSQLLNDALKQAGVESTLEVILGAKHGGPEFTTPERRKTIMEFLDKHLKPAGIDFDPKKSSL
jgi:acetyl esterase/lipase